MHARIEEFVAGEAGDDCLVCSVSTETSGVSS